MADQEEVINSNRSFKPLLCAGCKNGPPQTAVFVKCFVDSCSYWCQIVYGKNTEVESVEAALIVLNRRLRKHIAMRFRGEHTRGDPHYALQDGVDDTWDSLLQDDDGGFEMRTHDLQKWDTEKMAPQCAHHPLNAESALTKGWQVRDHRLKEDEEEETQGEELCRTIKSPVDYAPNFDGHWPSVLRKSARCESGDKTRKRRRSIQYGIARAAVKGFEKYKRARTKPRAVQRAKLGVWTREAHRFIKAAADVQRIAHEIRDPFQQEPTCSTMKTELQAILDSAEGFPELGLSLEDIIPEAAQM